MGNTIVTMRAELKEAFNPILLEIVDESHLHAGHAGAEGGGGHYAVTIVSEAFEGKRTLLRHREVYKVLGDDIGGRIHALALATFTPGEWAENPKGTGTVSTRR